MNTAQKVIAALALLVLSAGSLAARPTSIVFNTNAKTDDGRPYAQFTVQCNDGRAVSLTAWDGRRKWCVGTVGEISSLSCDKKQISAAKTACMDA
tara:strand:- start:77260 stop:77544 length:285 start_codon:yes stop_codon:yes gene_type:complete